MGVSLFVVCIFWKIFSENRIKDELFGGGGTIKPPSSLDGAIVHTHTGTRTRTHPDRILSGAALVLMELIRRRMVIQTRRLWAVRVESCRDSDSGVQQLHVLPHGHHSRNRVMISVFEEDPDEKYYKERILLFFFFFWEALKLRTGKKRLVEIVYIASPPVSLASTFLLSSPFLSPSRAFLIWCWALCLNMKFFYLYP